MTTIDNALCAYLLTKSKHCLNTILLVLAEQEDNKQEEIEKRNWSRFNLNSKSNHFCRHNFRFNSDEIIRLKIALKIPDEIKTADRSIFNGVEALCILLRRLAYPNRLGDLDSLFGRGPSQLSMIVNWMLVHVEGHFGYLTNSMDLFWLQHDFLQIYATKIAEKGAPLENCVGFIDGTLRPTCRPTRNQQAAYSGHKRNHGIKFQSVTVPNGLICHLFGPIEGSRHDSYMLSESQLLEKLEVHFYRGNSLPPYCLYGDPAYANRPELISPFKGVLQESQQKFNHAMSKVRQSVEWEFGKVAANFAFCDYKKNLKIYLQAVSRYYKVCVILSNCHTCFNGSQTSKYFDLDAPSVEEYLSNTQIEI